MESHGARIDGHEHRCIIVVLCLYLKLGHAQLMLEEYHETGWNVVSLERLYGRGVNLQIEVPDVPTLAQINKHLCTDGQLCGRFELYSFFVCVYTAKAIDKW